MIWKIAPAIACLAILAGCVSAPLAPNESQQLADAFERRIVSCVLPYLYDPAARLSISYRYHDGATTFRISPPDAGLHAHVLECAAPESGPLAQFSGTVEIWAKR
jgi:hypothetical protein